jgi:hypothetical protein
MSCLYYRLMNLGAYIKDKIYGDFNHFLPLYSRKKTTLQMK